MADFDFRPLKQDLQEPKDVDDVVERRREELSLCPVSHPGHSTALNTLANAVQFRFEQQGHLKDLEEAIWLHRAVLALCPVPHAGRSISLSNLGCALQVQAEQTGSSKDLQEAVELHREALSVCPAPHPDRSIFLNNLGCAVRTLFEQRGGLGDLMEAIDLHREALTLCPVPLPGRSASLNNLGRAIRLRFQQQGDFADLKESVELHREALALCPALHPERSMILNNLANAVRIRFMIGGNFGDLDEAIELYKTALSLCPGAHPRRGTTVNNLAGAIQTRFQQQGGCGDLEKAIELYRAALALLPIAHPHRSMSLDNLANALRTRFEQQGNFGDLDEAIELHRAAFALCPPLHPDHSASLNNLAGAVQTRFQQKGDLKNLDEAIELHRAALDLRPPGHPDRSGSLNNLAGAVQSRFEQKGDLRDLDEAIKLQREALALCPAPHPHHSITLNNLARAVQRRFDQHGDSKDIEEVVELHRAAIKLRPAPHPHRNVSLHNLARAFQTRFEQQGHISDLEEAIVLHRSALALCPTLHPDRSMMLNNLAGALQIWYDVQKDSGDLEEAIKLLREAAALSSTFYPDRSSSLNNLASAVRTRFLQKGDRRDLEEAIELPKAALSLLSASHPDRGISLNLLGQSLAQKYRNDLSNDDLNAAISALQAASVYPYSSPLKRFQHTHSWASIAAQFNHDSALRAYKTTSTLLPQIVALHLDVVSRQRILSTLRASQLASEASVCAIDKADYDGAVELLEGTRSIFWSQALQLRTPLHRLQVAEPTLASKLQELATELEVASFRDTSRTLGSDNQAKILAVEAQGTRYQRLNEEWNKTIEVIRSLPGLANFMKPKTIAALRKAAASGPVVVLITSFALIVTILGQVQCVPLPILNRERMVDVELRTRLLGYPEGYKSSEEIFSALLGDLWTSIAKPVLDALGLKKTNEPPRIWWCPTGPLTFLPIHAAGIYTKDGTDCVSDYVVSSYTPTLAALLDPPEAAEGFSFKMTAVIQSAKPKFSDDFGPLPGSRKEFDSIQHQVASTWLAGLGVKTDAVVEDALIHLRQSSVVHFACHGTQDLAHPLESGLILSDGRLKVSELMHKQEGENQENYKPHISLAFLSACETAKGDRETPDEAMHLAATLLFAGFRTVVGTMWDMQDEDGPRIANKFYEFLFKGCDPDSKPPIVPDLIKSADALHYAVTNLRKEPGVTFKRWVPFVHYGL
ncbi:TPR-like protein [Mycena leptocephala]|nr:TPR-like protein [Mycena leptocephala]